MRASTTRWSVAAALLLLAVLAVGMLPGAQAQGDAPPCNCAGCSRPQNPGSVGWCNCCRTAQIGECVSTCELQAQMQGGGNFIYDAEGCLRDGYPELCEGDAPTPTPPPPTRQPTREPPTQTSMSQDTSPPVTDTTSRPTLTTCNCAGCSNPGHFPGTPTWCRCCAVDAFDCPCLGGGTSGNIYEFEGCQQNGFADLCGSVDDYADRIGAGGSTGEGSSDSTTAIIIVVVVLVLLLACIGILWYVSRDERQKREAAEAELRARSSRRPAGSTSSRSRARQSTRRSSSRRASSRRVSTV